MGVMFTEQIVDTMLLLIWNGSCSPRHWSTSGASLLSSLVNAFFVHSITVQIILVSWQSLKHAVTTGVTYRIRLEKKKGSWNHWQVRGKIISRWKSSYVRREASQLFPISGLKFTLVPTPVVANIPHLWRRWWESCWMGPRTEQRFTPPLCVAEDLQGISRGKFHYIGPVRSFFL